MSTAGGFKIDLYLKTHILRHDQSCRSIDITRDWKNRRGQFHNPSRKFLFCPFISSPLFLAILDSVDFGQFHSCIEWGAFIVFWIREIKRSWASKTAEVSTEKCTSLTSYVTKNTMSITQQSVISRDCKQLMKGWFITVLNVVFTPVCDSVHRGVSGTPPPRQTPLGQTLPPSDGNCSRRYVSYWNAFLFIYCRLWSTLSLNLCAHFVDLR